MSREFIAVKQLEAGIRKVVRSANGPNVVAFPIYEAFKRARRQRSESSKKNRPKFCAQIPSGQGPEAA